MQDSSASNGVLLGAAFVLGAAVASVLCKNATPSAQKHQTQRVDCTRVYVKKTKYGDGAFAACDIKKGELVESGIVRRIPVDGNKSEYVFTW
jgi:hypothetical protein